MKRGIVRKPKLQRTILRLMLWLSKITKKYLVIVGAFIRISVVSMILSVIGFFIVIEDQAGLDRTQRQVCAGFEDVVEKALTPLDPVPDPTPEQLEINQHASAQKLERMKDIKKELYAHSDCKVSIND